MSPLAALDLFRDLPEPALARLDRAAVRLRPADRATLFVQGDPADAVYAVIGGDGCVRVGASGRDKALMVEMFRAGDVFGEIAVIDGGTRTAGAAVEGRVELARIPAGVFLAVLHDTPALGASLSRVLSRRLRRTFELFRDATFEPLEVRLARQLLYLAALDGRRTEQGVRVPGRFRQPDLADLLGTTARSIIKILNVWREKGWVAYDTERALLTLRHEAALRALTTDFADDAPREATREATREAGRDAV